ncbi:MAG: RNA polymerase sigma factor [Myxococcales bacterium]|nr:RNA polymerase sigma factor [Myxococcales bacterium]
MSVSKAKTGVDEEFVLACQKGDHAAFRRLYNEYKHKIVGIVRNVIGPTADLDDVVQTVFVEIYKSIRHYKGDSKLSTWIYRLSVNVALQHIRRAKRRRWFILTSDTEVLERTLPVDIIGQVEGRQMLQKIYELLDTIKPKKRTVYILHELQGMDVDEISEVVGVPTNTVKSRLFHARKEMLAKLAKARMM